jgi:hypothetical protein
MIKVMDQSYFGLLLTVADGTITIENASNDDHSSLQAALYCHFNNAECRPIPYTQN